MCIKLYPKRTPMAIAPRFRLAKTFAKLAQNIKAVEHLNQALDLNEVLDPERQNVGSELAEAQLLLKQSQENN